MKRHSWKIMMKVSIQRKRRGADVIVTSIRSDGENLKKSRFYKPMPLWFDYPGTHSSHDSAAARPLMYPRRCKIMLECREAMSKNKTMDAMQRYKYKVVTAQRRSKQMLTFWRSQFSCMCKYWDVTIKNRVSGQLAAPTSTKGKKGASTGKGAKGGGASGTLNPKPQTLDPKQSTLNPKNPKP